MVKNIFEEAITAELIERIQQLNNTKPQLWGKMNVAQMLAHCNVTYEMVYDNKYPKPSFWMRLIFKTFVKNMVVNEKSYKHNAQTAPVFIISETKKFEEQKIRLIEHLTKTHKLGENYFDRKESHSFGVLTKTEWNNMFYKHLDHHLKQFGV